MTDQSKFFLRLSHQRETNFFKGIRALQFWISEIYTNGIQLLHSHPKKIEEISTILVDFGLPGMARKLRLIPEQLKKDTGKSDRLYALFAELALFLNFCDSISDLSAESREDLLTYAGIPMKKSDLPESNFITDHWFYLGNRKEKEENMLLVRHWFYGAQSRKCVLFMEFLFGRFPKEQNYLPGTVYYAPVCLYPSAYPLRVAHLNIGSRVSGTAENFQGISLHDMLNEYCRISLLNPFIKELMFLIKDIQMARNGNEWFAQSHKGELISISNPMVQIPKILIYIGQAGSLFCCEYFNRTIRIVSIISNQRILSLD